MDAVPKDLLKLGTDVCKQYSSLSSAEIWNEEAVYETLKQLEFYSACGFFAESKQVSQLCDCLLELIGMIQNEASAGVKTEGGEFRMYNNEILIADNTVFALMGDRRCVYANQSALNLYLTFQEPFCEQTETYLRNLIRQSTLISKTGERERNRFFNKMSARIQDYKKGLK